MTIKKFFTGAALVLGTFGGIMTLLRLPSDIVHAQSAGGGGFVITVALPPTQTEADDKSQPDSIQFGTLLTSDGGLIGNVAPLGCLHGDSSIGLLVGSWKIDGLTLKLQMRGPIYDRRGKTISTVSINGTSSGLSGNIGGTATFSGLTEKTGCKSLNGITTSWTGQPVFASTPPPNEIP
jgi:hypothetical protein